MTNNSLCSGNGCPIKDECARYVPNNRINEQRIGTAMCMVTHLKTPQYLRFKEKNNG